MDPMIYENILDAVAGVKKRQLCLRFTFLIHCECREWSGNEKLEGKRSTFKPLCSIVQWSVPAAVVPYSAPLLQTQIFCSTSIFCGLKVTRFFVAPETNNATSLHSGWYRI